MAEEAREIFTKKASEKLRSPDDLDEYLRVTNPNVWVVLAACITLLAGLFVWGVFGTAETSVTTVGTCVEGEALCFLPSEKVSSVHVGDVANVGGETMQVKSISAVPVSREEARRIVGGDYLTSTLVEVDWTYVVHFGGEVVNGFEEGVPFPVTITTERIPPISLVLKDAS